MHSKFPRITRIPWSFTSRATLKSPNSEKVTHLQKNPAASAIKWLGRGVIQVSIFERLLLEGKVKIGKHVSVSASVTGRPLLRLASHIPL